MPGTTAATQVFDGSGDASGGFGSFFGGGDFGGGEF